MTRWQVAASLLVLIGLREYRLATVEVRDAESGEAISDSAVRVHYKRYMDFFPPRDSAGKTDQNGTVKLRVAETNRLLEITVAADGYLGKRLSYGSHAFFEGQRDKKLVVNLYRKPTPTIDLIFPKGFMGVVKIRRNRTNELIQGRPGQRHFAFRVPDSGHLEIPANRLLCDSDPIAWTAKYDDGVRIRSLGDDGGPIADGTFALRWVACDAQDEDLFVIGRSDDAQKVVDSVHTSSIEHGCQVQTFDREAYNGLKLGKVP